MRVAAVSTVREKYRTGEEGGGRRYLRADSEKTRVSASVQGKVCVCVCTRRYGEQVLLEGRQK